MDFAGFRVTESDVEPLPKFMESIRNFPTPSSMTDIRSWFGLVNQASHYSQLRMLMEPFWQFLSPKVPFEWNKEMDKIFEKSKLEIVEAIRHGVKIFNVKRKTCLRTDWSTTGIGFYLSQKHCECSEELPGCCDSGWRIALEGWRFLHQSESRYCPVEGECLAAAWALEQSHFFTWGCDSLVLVTDHKPLERILGRSYLDEIANTRLFRLVQRMLLWVFKVVYMPGKTNWVADGLLRNTTSIVQEAFGLEEDPELEVAAVTRENCKRMMVIKWSRVREQTEKDPLLQKLILVIVEGFPSDRRDMDDELLEYWRCRDGLFVQDGMVMFENRVVVPQVMRGDMLETLHLANQGVSSMAGLAQGAVFWPGISGDIERTRRSCSTCNRAAPLQAKPPPVEPQVPLTPFECILADYCHVGKAHYLVTADRLSGWIEVEKVAVGSSLTRAKGLIACL